MKRLIVLLLLGGNLFGNTRFANVAKKTASHNRSFSSVLNNNFGKTHFIVDDTREILSGQPQSVAIEEKKSSNASPPSLIDRKRISQAFFTTKDDISSILLEAVSMAQNRLYIAAFLLTDIRIVNKIIEVHKSGVDVCIITDAGNMKKSYSKIRDLVNNNVPVWYFKPSLNPAHKKNSFSEPLMHHKFVIFDDEVISGSANYTKAGQKSNADNIVIIREEETVKEYHSEIERIKERCVPCTRQKLE
ncbi:MAG TPA: phospholipase D-like domain-containing protein [Candidatus Babeliales bacterium]|nr:phospholipase D-like domain-containing protein [Candidatus Babeliales bacterium]